MGCSSQLVCRVDRPHCRGTCEQDWRHVSHVNSLDSGEKIFQAEANSHCKTTYWRHTLWSIPKTARKREASEMECGKAEGNGGSRGAYRSQSWFKFIELLA